MPGISNVFSQFYPPKPKFTEKNLPDLHGKVYIVTGANSGVGKELTRILYSKNAKVYLFTRSQEKAIAAIKEIKTISPTSTGALTYIHLDLADLSTIKTSVQEFLSKESKLHILFNNAGVMDPPAGSNTVQGHELQLGVNALGPFLLTKLLTPILISTSASLPSSSVRVIWVSSLVAELGSPKPGGVPLSNLNYHKEESNMYKYNVSKAGVYLLAAEYSKRNGNGNGIVSVALNPGNLDSELTREMGSLTRAVVRKLVLHPPRLGAYTVLFAGFCEDGEVGMRGGWVIPWGRMADIRADLFAATKTEGEGGSGIGEKFWEWCEEQVKTFV